MSTAPVTPTEELIRVDATPKDDKGQPIGPPQIFEGKTHQEVLDKMAQAQQHASLKIQELKKERQPIYEEPSQEFKPRDLSADELFKIHQDMQDPSKMREAYRKLSEAEFGAPPERIRAALGDTNFSKEKARIEREAQKFTDAHPEYIACEENWKHIEEYFNTHKDDKGRYLSPVQKNFEMIFEELKEKQLLHLQDPIKIETPAPKEEVITPKPATRPRATTTGLFSQHSSASAPAKPTQDQFAQEVAKMSSQEYKRRLLSEPGFAAKVNALSKAASR